MTRRPSNPLFEALERRALLSATAPLQSAADAGYVSIIWNGQQAFAKPGQWIARFEGVRGKAAQQLDLVNTRLAGKAGFQATRHLGDDGLVLLRGPGNQGINEVRGAMKNVRGLKHIQPDLGLTIQSMPNDPSFGQLWGLHNTGQSGGIMDADIDAPEAWAAFSTGRSGVVTAVIDTGVLYTHPDLAANMWRNPGEIPGDGIDNDGNGFVDDVFGYDFVNNTGNPIDTHSHGTHVAGTIAAVGNNELGVTGVNWSGQIMALKFIGDNGWGKTSDAIRAINYATMMKTQHGVNVRVTNNSWGGGAFDIELHNAIKNSGEAGMLFVAAAGNGGADGIGDNNDLFPQYPASYALPNVISVAATDRRDALASFSNYGATSVHLGAPGVAILSTNLNNGYAAFSGTSMASPHVAGVASLAYAYNPGVTMAEVKGAILGGVDPIAALSGKSVTGGRLNAFGALQRLPLPGDVNGDGRVNLSDFNILAANFGSNSSLGRAAGDLNGDGMVNLADFNLLAANFGRTTTPAGTSVFTDASLDDETVGDLFA